MRSRLPGHASLVAVAAAVALAMTVAALAASPAAATHPACTVARVIDGDTFVCDDGAGVRMLQIDTPELGDCGGDWAAAALREIFLKPGTYVRLEYDAVAEDRYGRHLAAPIVTGLDGAEYNISVVMVYVGLAKAAYYGDNAMYLEWAQAAETWAEAAQWNMWEPGGPYAGGC